MPREKYILSPFSRIADVRGRATRFELFSFLFAGLVLSGAAGIAASLLLEGPVVGLVAAAPLLAFIVPGIALCVRRLHDAGWSGWWLLLFLPAVGIGLLQYHLQVRIPYPVLRPDLPWFAELPAAISVFAILAMLFWDDEAGANRYGPNPRGTPRGEPA